MSQLKVNPVQAYQEISGSRVLGIPVGLSKDEMDKFYQQRSEEVALTNIESFKYLAKKPLSKELDDSEIQGLDMEKVALINVLCNLTPSDTEIPGMVSHLFIINLSLVNGESQGKRVQ